MASTRFLNRYSPPHILTLVLVTGLGALSMNIILPSLPSISAKFSADKSIVQLTISAYLFAIGLLQPLLGPLSDYFGRRPLILIGLAGFVIGTTICLLATSIEMLLIGRMFQALSATGMVVSRAIIRDMVERDQAASMIGYVTMGMSLAPMAGPIIGGYLDEFYGWQSSFFLLLIFGALVIFVAWFDLGETRKTRAPNLTSQFKSYPRLLRSRRFWGYSLSASFCSAAFFSLLGGGPYAATEYFHLTPSQFGANFAFIAFGYMGGNFLSGRFAVALGINKMMLMGNIAAVVGILLSIFLLIDGSKNSLLFFIPLILLGIGNGMTLPNANAGIVSVHPSLAGAASGLSGFFQIMGGASISVLAAWVMGPNSHPIPLLALMLATSALAVFATLYVFYIDRLEARNLAMANKKPEPGE